MTHLESIEPRLLLAGTSLDTTFADAGTLHRTTPGVSDGTALVEGLSLFLDVKDGRRHVVEKWNHDGTLDTAWGNNGRFTFGIDVRAIAQDDRTRKLYLAGIDDFTLKILRLDPDGKIDPTFGPPGARGVVTFKATAPTAPDASNHALVLDVPRIVPLVHQQLLVAFQRTTWTAPFTTDGSYPRQGADELVLMRLRPGGHRDAAFGKRGTVTVVSGRIDKTYSNPITTHKLAEPTFGDLLPDAVGGCTVVASQRPITFSGVEMSDSYARTSNGFDVVSRHITPDGKIDPEQDHTWTIISASEADGRERVFVPLAVHAQGSGNAVVAGHVTIGERRATPNLVIRLAPGAKPIASSLPAADAEAARRILISPRHERFVIAPGQVTKLTFTLSDPPEWGDNHIAQIPGVGDAPGWVGDSLGRLLVIEPDAVRRYRFPV